LSEQRNQLRELLVRRSLRRGDFVLSSGRRSSYYIDARITTMSGLGQMLIGRLGLDLIDDALWKPRSVGGLTLGADPVAYAIAHTAALEGRELDAFTVRKEPKTHGTGKLVEGVYEPGWDVVVVEDTITTGESTIRAIQSLRDSNARIIGVLALVDRQEGGADRIRSEGLDVRSLFEVSELL
jgi:orotate phosphoribosyltransferase